MIKKITIVTPYFAPAWSYGGPPRVLYTLARELVRNKIKINVITTDALDEKRNRTFVENLDGIQVNRFPMISNTLAYRYKIFYVHNLSVKVLEILKPTDAVLFSDLRTLLNWQIYKIVQKFRIPYGIFPFGQIPYDKSGKSIIKRLFDQLWVKDFVSHASWRFAQTAHEQAMYGRYFDIDFDKTQLLYLPAPSEVYRVTERETEQFRKKWNIKKHDKVILFVGRLHVLKGVDILIKSVLPLIQEDRSVKLLIVGRDDGVLERLTLNIPKDCRGNVIFTRGLYGRDVACAYQAADCFAITPRFYEETSMAALTALSHSVPVVTTVESEVPFLDKYNAGITVSNSIIDIQKSLIKILSLSQIQRDRMGRNAVQLVNDKFRADKIAQRLIKIIY